MYELIPSEKEYLDIIGREWYYNYVYNDRGTLDHIFIHKKYEHPRYIFIRVPQEYLQEPNGDFAAFVGSMIDIKDFIEKHISGDRWFNKYFNIGYLRNRMLYNLIIDKASKSYYIREFIFKPTFDYLYKDGVIEYVFGY